VASATQNAVDKKEKNHSLPCWRESIREPQRVLFCAQINCLLEDTPGCRRARGWRGRGRKERGQQITIGRFVFYLLINECAMNKLKFYQAPAVEGQPNKSNRILSFAKSRNREIAKSISNLPRSGIVRARKQTVACNCRSLWNIGDRVLPEMPALLQNREFRAVSSIARSYCIDSRDRRAQS